MQQFQIVGMKKKRIVTPSWYPNSDVMTQMLSIGAKSLVDYVVGTTVIKVGNLDDHPNSFFNQHSNSINCHFFTSFIKNWNWYNTGPRITNDKGDGYRMFRMSRISSKNVKDFVTGSNSEIDITGETNTMKGKPR